MDTGVLPYAFHHVLKDADEKTRSSCIRLLNIWQERGVYDAGFIQAMKQTKDTGGSAAGGGGVAGVGAGAAVAGGGAKGRNDIVPILKNSRPADNKISSENEKNSRKGSLIVSCHVDVGLNFFFLISRKILISLISI